MTTCGSCGARLNDPTKQEDHYAGWVADLVTLQLLCDICYRREARLRAEPIVVREVVSYDPRPRSATIGVDDD